MSLRKALLLIAGLFLLVDPIKSTVADTATSTLKTTVANTAAPTIKTTVADTAAPTIKTTVADTATSTLKTTVTNTPAPTIKTTVADTATSTLKTTVANTTPTIKTTVASTAAPATTPAVTSTVETATIPEGNGTDGNVTTLSPPTNPPPAEQTITIWLKLSMKEFEKQKNIFIENIKEQLFATIYLDDFRPLYDAYDSCDVDVTAKESGDGILEVTVVLTNCPAKNKETFIAATKKAVESAYPNAEFYETKPETGLVAWQIALIVVGSLLIVIILAAVACHLSRRKRIASEYEMHKY